MAVGKIEVDDLRKFVGRRGPFARQNSDGSYMKCMEDINDQCLKDHLEGKYSFGTYTITADNKCNYVCWDIDTNNPGDVYKLLPHITGPYVVEFSGRKGYHVWQLFESPIPADLAYHYALEVKTKSGLDCEAFPKQSGIKEGELGNLVKLPFGVHAVTGQRSRLVAGKIAYATTPTLDPEFMPPPPKAEKKYNGNNGQQGDWLVDIFEGELEEGGGRNNAMNRFVFWLYSRGFPEELVRQNAEYVNQECFGEPLPEREMEILLRRR